MSLLLRSLEATDLNQVMRIQAACYPAHFNEAAEIFAQRIADCGKSSWLALRDGQALAYLFSYPSLAGKVCPLGSEFSPVRAANCLYLHDMAVLPQAHGQGIASALLSNAMQYARRRDINQSALVAVQNSAPFWQKLGYQASYPLDPAQQQNLLSYGEDAVYLFRHIAP